MKTKENLAQEKLARLCQVLADEIDELSDEELLAEEMDNGEEIAAIADNVGGVISEAVSKVGRNRLVAARAGYEATANGVNAPVLNWTFEQKRKLMLRFAENDDEVKKKLTLAARNGEETEADVDSFIEDLLALDAIDDEGNVT